MISFPQTTSRVSYRCVGDTLLGRLDITCVMLVYIILDQLAGVIREVLA